MFYCTLFRQICIHKTDELQEINACLSGISATYLFSSFINEGIDFAD